MLEHQPHLQDSLIGASIDGRYTIREMLGRGGMGVVYGGAHDGLGRAVAIKVLTARWASDEVAVERLLRAARTASSLSHGNIVDVTDLGRLPDGRPYLVMPKVQGTDFASLLAYAGPQLPRRVAELLGGIASALDLIHVKGLVHRDIKPENLMYVVREDGSETVMLLDFGIATLVRSNQPRLTREGTIFGTPEYQPPEVSDGRLPDGRGDVYALATVVFELITGRLPFHADDRGQILAKKLGRDPPTLERVSGKRFPLEVEAVIARGLARDHAIFGSGLPQARPRRRSPHRRRLRPRRLLIRPRCDPLLPPRNALPPGRHPIPSRRRLRPRQPPPRARLRL